MTFKKFQALGLLLSTLVLFPHCNGDEEIPPSEQLEAFCAVIAQTAHNPLIRWLGGSEGLMLNSTDGGQNYFQVQAQFNESISDMSFSPDGQTGYAVGANSTYANSTDGGLNWNVQFLGTGLNLNAITWAPGSSSLGWIVGDGGTIYYTLNAGQNWVLQDSMTTENLHGVCFSDDMSGWAVGDHGTIVGTIDAGNTWEKWDSGVTVNLRSCFNYDGSFGIAVGFGGTILETIDGGLNWTPQISGTTIDLYDIKAKPGEENLLLVGGDGGILRTTNFGNDWETVFDEIEAGFDLFLKKMAFGEDPYAQGAGYTAVGDGFDFMLIPDLLAPGVVPSTDGLLVESNDDGQNWVKVDLKVQF